MMEIHRAINTEVFVKKAPELIKPKSGDLLCAGDLGRIQTICYTRLH